MRDSGCLSGGLAVGTACDQDAAQYSSAFGDTFRLPLAFVAVAILPALFLPQANHHRERSQGK